MRRNIFVSLVLVIAFITSAGCGHDNNARNYQLDYYIDTIQGHVILSAVCLKKDGGGISISSIAIGSTEAIVSKTDESIKTSFIWQDSRGDEFPVYMSNEGSCFVVKTSQGGEEYKVYLDNEVFEQIRKELRGKEY